jgi:ATP-binding cassette subfamily B protein
MSSQTDQNNRIPNQESVRSIAKRRSGQFILSGLLSAVASGMGLMPYLAVYWITVHLFANGPQNADFSYVLWVAGASLGATIIKAATQGVSLHVSHVAAYDALYDIRVELAKKLGAFPLSWFDRRNTGAIKRVLHENVEKMEEALAHAIPEMAAALSVPLLSIIALFIVDWRMALALLVTPILGTLLAGLLMQLTAEDSRIYNGFLDRMNSVIIQYINGMRVIKAFTQSQASFAGVKKLVDDIGAYYIDMGKRAQNPWSAATVWRIAVSVLRTC